MILGEDADVVRELDVNGRSMKIAQWMKSILTVGQRVRKKCSGREEYLQFRICRAMWHTATLSQQQCSYPCRCEGGTEDRLDQIISFDVNGGSFNP